MRIPIQTPAEPNDDDDDAVMFIPTPSVPCEKQPVLNIDDDVNPISTLVIPCEKQQPITNDDDVDVDVPCEQQPIVNEDDLDIEVDPIPTPLQIVKPKGWKPPKRDFRPKLPVLRKQSKHVETEMEPPPSPSNINDVIIENAEFWNKINQHDKGNDEANEPIQSDANDEGNAEKTTPKKIIKRKSNLTKKIPKTTLKKRGLISQLRESLQDWCNKMMRWRMVLHLEQNPCSVRVMMNLAVQACQSIVVIVRVFLWLIVRKSLR